MERLFELLVPIFVVLYFVASTVYAVLKRLGTPPLSWPDEPQEPGESPRWEPSPFEDRPGEAGAPSTRPSPAAPIPESEPLPRRPVAEDGLGHGGAAGVHRLPGRARQQEVQGPEGAALRVEPASAAPRPRAAAVRQRLRRKLQGAGLRDAILLSEVIGRPRALRPYAPPPLEKR